MKFYVARFAPSAATWRDTIRVGQLVPHNGKSVYEAFAPHAFAGWEHPTIPILLDHDPTRKPAPSPPSHPTGTGTSVLRPGRAYTDQAAEYISRSGAVSLGCHEINKAQHWQYRTRPPTPPRTGTHAHDSTRSASSLPAPSRGTSGQRSRARASSRLQPSRATPRPTSERGKN